MRLGRFIFVCQLLLSMASGSALAAPVSPSRATELASGWLCEGSTRLGKELSLQMQATIPYSNDFGEISFYAIQLVPQGLIIVSANDLVEPVIAFSDSGTTNDLVFGNPLWAMLCSDLAQRNEEARMIEASYVAPAALSMSGAMPTVQPEHAQANKAKWERYAQSAKTSATRVTSLLAAAQTDPMDAESESPSYGGLPSVSDQRIAPILQTKWSQLTAQGLTCYNYFTPSNYYAGCVATAMAQLLRYWQYPVTGIGQLTCNITVAGNSRTATTRGGDDLGGAYPWSDMPLDPQQGMLTPAGRQAIGRLLADCGTTVSMIYTGSGSAASLLAARQKLVSVFGFSNARYLYTVGGIAPSVRNGILMSNLAAGYPVLTGISQTASTSGHAVITDGLGYASSTRYFHVNYGWGGGSDAWYNMPGMDSSPAYNVVDLLVYNAFPTNTGELISGRIVNATATPLQGVSITATNAGSSFTALSDAKGYYGIIVPGGATYVLTACTPGYAVGTVTGIVVRATSTYFDAPANYWGGDITLASESLQSVPTLNEWGLIIFAVSIVYFGARFMEAQQAMQERGVA